MLQVGYPLLKPSILQVKGLTLELEIEILLLSFEKLFLEHSSTALLVSKIIFELFNFLLPALFKRLTSANLIHGLAYKHLHFMSLVVQLFNGVLQSFLEHILFGNNFTKLSLQTNLHRLLQSCIYRLKMEYLIFKLLNLVDAT